MSTLSAADVMTRAVMTIRDDRTVEELASFLIEEGLSAAPVVNRSGELVGVVTATDLVEDRNECGEAARTEGRVIGWQDKMSADELARLELKTEGRLVRDIMTRTVYTVPIDTPVPELARAMVAGRVHRLFVTRRGELIGTVSALDLLKLLYEAKPEAVSSGTTTAR